jgi:tRNA G46 methylase TrmB
MQPINVPDHIQQLSHTSAAERVIDVANEKIESYLLANDWVTENFVPCDFHLLDQALTWIDQNHLLAGQRFCELGSGFGVATLLASLHGMDSVGIEIEAYLVDQAIDLSNQTGVPASFYCGSFVPRDVDGILELGRDVERVQTGEDDVYQEMEASMKDFDLFFAFPWPGERYFFEAVFEAGAGTNALLLCYDGRNGMQLVRKV